MVELHSDHPARLSVLLRRRLGQLSFRSKGYLQEYITNKYGDLWTLNDRVFWLTSGQTVLGWAVRAQEFPYDSRSFMVYITAKYRRKGWGTVLYNYAMHRPSVDYEVYGSHSEEAGSFYEKLRGWDYN